MNKMIKLTQNTIKYYFGSEDSLDTDVCYVVKYIPSIEESKQLCRSILNENINLIVIRYGCVVDCFKGNVDEVNNSIIDTYFLHKQQFPLLITKRLSRNVVDKLTRCCRSILMQISRTSIRRSVKTALRSTLTEQIEFLRIIKFEELGTIEKRTQSEADSLKLIAFQLAQTIALLDGIEIYTKRTAAEYLPELKQFIYRESTDNLEILTRYKDTLIEKVARLNVL